MLMKATRMKLMNMNVAASLLNIAHRKILNTLDSFQKLMRYKPNTARKDLMKKSRKDNPSKI